MQSSKPKARQRQLRSFVIAWLGVTLLMGALTFVGIYYATGVVNADASDPTDDNVAALPNPEVDTTSDDAFDPNQIATTPVPTAEQVVQAEQDIQVVEEPLDQPDAAQVAAQDMAVDDSALDDKAAAPAAESAAPMANAAQNAGQNSGPAAAPLAQDAPTPVPTATPLPVNNTAFQLGIQVLPSLEREVQNIWMGDVRDKLRLNWVKYQVRWAEVEPSPGQYDWAKLDIALQSAAEYHTNVMLSVLETPEWAREEGNQQLDEVGPPADPQVYANFLITMLYRYPGQIHAIEVWNEMNIDREWASIYGLSAENYVNLLRAAYTGIKSVDPGVIVISGALAPTGVNDGVGAYDDFVYMDMMIAAGMLDTTDCVGAHHNGYNIGPTVPVFAGQPAPNDPTATFRGPFDDNPHHSWSFYTTLNGYAQRIQQAGSDKKLCITEFGWASTEGLNGYPPNFEFANDNTLAEQAQFIDEAIQAMESWGFVWIAWVWNLNYGAPNWVATDDNVPYGLLRPEWQNAPAYDVIAKYDFRSR